MAKRPPQRRATDPGRNRNGDGKDFGFYTFRQVLTWLIGLMLVAIPSLLWLDRTVAEKVVNDHEAVEQKELIAKIEAVRNDLTGKMAQQWPLFYTKNDATERAREIDRRLDILDRMGSEVRNQQMEFQRQQAVQTAILETIKARQADNQRR